MSVVAGALARGCKASSEGPNATTTMTVVQFEHTHLGVYLVGAFAVTCLYSDSAQGLIERHQLNRKWLLLYGVLCIFAYLYARPFIRVGLGSAKRGYINFSTLYIVWLCSAVFYHLPSLEQLGLDVRADVSMLIVAFMSSLAALSVLAGLHTAAVSMGLLSRRAYLPAAASAGGSVSPSGAPGGARGASASRAGTGLRELWILLLLNSMIIAVACSTYYSFCGNGTLVVDSGTPAFKAAVCAKWLHPILTSDYPRFASWMLYGEGSAYTLAGGNESGSTDSDVAPDADFRSGFGEQDHPASSPGYGGLIMDANGYVNESHIGGGGNGGCSTVGYISVDFPLDGRGVQSVPAGDVLSPVLCMWVTLVAVYIANTLAGHPRLVQAAASDAIAGSSSSRGGGGSSRMGISDFARQSVRSGASGALSKSSSSSSLSVRRAASFRRMGLGAGERPAKSGGAAGGRAGGTAGAAAGPPAGPAGAAGGGDGIRKSRHRHLEVKKPINKGLSKAAAASGLAPRGTAAVAALAAAGSAARGAAAAAARRSLSSLHGLAASTFRLRRAASDYLHNSHPYLPALLGQVRRGMAALEPNHLAAELAEATGLAPDLARALTHGSSFSALTGAPSGSLSASSLPAFGFGADHTYSDRPAVSSGATAAGTGTGTLPPFYMGGAGAGASCRSYRAGNGGGSGAINFGLQMAVDQVSAAELVRPSPIAPGPPPQPNFLDMVPWYSGTSADLIKTLFDLMVSVKLFLGRFDMRTMQAATAASMADSFNDTPSEGDGFTYEHLDERSEIWLDFIADTGDGGNPTYAVASALAAPALTVAVSEDLPLPAPHAQDSGKDRNGKASSADAGAPSPPRPGSLLVLPRGDVLLVGGDLAYPNPSRETYLRRLFSPFSDALPPPPHFHSGRLVVHKPDLPAAWGVQEAHLPCDLRGLSPRSSRRASSAALRRYAGPTAFAIPGNHDWIDGLETFTREIQHKGWLGGWLLPQEKSYFALRLPAGWWLFGFDLALVQDIDMQQYRYFANVVEQRMDPDDQVILMTHEPLWLLEWFWQRRHGANLRQLVRGHLRGRARLHLAGDLHFYMRHTWSETAAAEAAAPVLHGDGGCAFGGGDCGASTAAGSDGMSPCGRSSAAPSEDLLQAPWSATSPYFTQTPTATAIAAVGEAALNNGCSSTDELPLGGSSDEAPSGLSTVASYSSLERSSDHRGKLPLQNHPRVHGGDAHPPDCCPLQQQHPAAIVSPVADAALRRIDLPARSLCAACEARQRWLRHPHDPQHLVVNGGGGAFLHPTHVFAGARFPTPHDPAADATAGLYAAVALPCTCGIYSPGAAMYGGAPGGRLGPWLASGGWPPPKPQSQSQPQSSGLRSSRTRAVAGGLTRHGSIIKSDVGGGGGGGISGYATIGPEGEYVCAACYPSPRTSMHLGRRNLHVFRLRNTRFDVIGGVFYFLLVVSVLPRCSHMAEVLEADTPGKALSRLGTAYMETLGAILGRSYVSAAALALLFLITLGLAKGGGFGALKSTSSTPNGNGNGNGSNGAAATAAAPAVSAQGACPVQAPRPLLAARVGGFGVQLAFATAHCMTHVTLAIVLLLLLELGVETCIKYERLGADGPHSLYRWYRAYEEQHFPDPKGLRLSLQRWTMGLYPGVLQLTMSVYDVPELIAVARTTMCEAGGSLEVISRLQAVSYYGGMLAYYWLLATPAMGFVFGLYLYLSVCWCHVHYDEAFSSLREANCKSFCRMRIGPTGDLQLYTLALDEVPTRWQEDPRWRGPYGGGSPGIVAHEAHYPSRWAPAGLEAGRLQSSGANAHGAFATSVSANGAATPAGVANPANAAPPSVRWRLVDYVFVPRKQM